jgi:hypothetical protein
LHPAKHNKRRLAEGEDFHREVRHTSQTMITPTPRRAPSIPCDLSTRNDAFVYLKGGSLSEEIGFHISRLDTSQ